MDRSPVAAGEQQMCRADDHGARVSLVLDLLRADGERREVCAQRGDDGGRQLIGARAGLGLGRREVGRATADHCELVADVYFAAVEVERVAFQAEDLAATPAAASGQVDDRPVPLGQGTRQGVHFLWARDVVLGIRDLRKPDARTGRHPDAPIDHGGVEQRHQRAEVHDCEGARREMLRSVLHPPTNMRVPDLRQRQRADDGHDVTADDALDSLGCAPAVQQGAGATARRTRPR